MTSYVAFGRAFTASRSPGDRYALMEVSCLYLETPATAASGIAMVKASTSATTKPRPPLPQRALERVSPLEGFPQSALDRVLPFDEPLSRISSLSFLSPRARRGPQFIPSPDARDEAGFVPPPFGDSTANHSFE